MCIHLCYRVMMKFCGACESRGCGQTLSTRRHRCRCIYTPMGQTSTGGVFIHGFKRDPASLSYFFIIIIFIFINSLNLVCFLTLAVLPLNKKAVYLTQHQSLSARNQAALPQLPGGRNNGRKRRTRTGGRRK